MAVALHPENTKAEYTRRLEVFIDRSRQNEKLYEFLSDILPSAIAAIGYDFNQQSQFNVLSIGSGEGQTDLEILRIIKNELKKSKELQATVKMFNRAIERNENAMAIYRATVKRLPHEFSSEEIAFDLDQTGTFEEYAGQPKDDVNFDLVHFIHCLYYIVEEPLVHCYNTELKEKGIIVICIGGLNDFMTSLQTPEYDIIHDNISSVLQKYSWKFEEHIQQHYYDVSEVFDPSSEEGNLLLDFIKVEVDFRSNNSAEDVKEFLGKIKKYCQYKDGKYFAKLEQRIIFIRK